MSFILYLLGKPNWHSVTPSPKPQNKDHKRLRKSPPSRNSLEKFYSCKDVFEVVRAQSCLTLVSNGSEVDDDSSCDASTAVQESVEQLPHIGYLLESRPSPILSDSVGVFLDKEIEASTFKRTRAKTPVFSIGQLEQKLALEFPEDTAQILAEQYQAILPSRTASPVATPLLTQSTPKSLRKIKSQKSLRDIAKDQPNTLYYWDSETLLSPQETPSPISPTHSDAANKELFMLQNGQDVTSQNEECPVSTEDEVGLGICIDLLTNQLARAFFRKHPAENEDRSSGLQILFMIEACEAVQRRARQQRHSCRMTGQNEGLLVDAEKIFNHWLRVLYYIYDCKEFCDFSDSMSDGAESIDELAI